MKAMLVDDNYQMLSYMKDCIPWEEKGVEILLCESGEEALDEAKEFQPDILITDIDMPEINGLQLIDRMLLLQPEMESLIISCHDKFEYAKDAMKLNVSEYILKDLLEPDSLLASVESLISKLQEKEKSRGEMDQLKSYIDQNKLSFKKQLLRGIMDNPLQDKEAYISQLHDCGLRLKEHYYLPFIGHINNKEELLQEFKSSELLLSAIENVSLEIAGEEGKLISFLSDEFGMIWFFEVESLIKSNPYEMLKNTIRNMEKAMLKYLGASISFIYGEKPLSDLKHLKMSLQKFTEIQAEWFYIKEKDILPVSAVDYSFASSNIFAEYQAIYEKIDQLISDLKEDAIEETVKEWISLFDKLKYHPNQVNSLIHNVLINISIKHQYIYQSDSSSAKELYSKVSNGTSICQLKKYMCRYITDIISYIKSENATQNEGVLKAKKYVEQHIDQKIRMEDVSKYLYMNSSYFSRLFKKETGITFTEYVTKTKVGKSTMYLIETDLTIDEIAVKLGYDNTSYYIKLFKKYFSTPPMEYRKNYKFV
ncbi:response regulator transcription factor [Alkalicoccus daliensis]|uniref:Two-component system, response regulator YesN n=1 Tax=Alkalicoccus daliensis TaxID=745820 RepID=A0A1H0GA54_9BACI|nr:response regulator [Alkalicoccus daliensis]SDO03763.1 two-component system, response regulator YesN [Alkalicoccus daliensis]